ncbi:MAG: serine/threonine-protein kinase [Bryobacteraceae bacterium]
MSFALGQVVGDYEFIDVVRSSHSSVSYRVRNLAENRNELLKVVVADPRRDSDLIQRFLRESRIHSGLRHPNILTCHKAFELQSRLVMTMELVEAVPLEDRLQTEPIGIEEVGRLMQQVLRALAFAHDCSVIHREVTPANILLTPDGIAKLAGFNLACVASDPRLTQVGAMVGSIHYMSPEQVRSEPLDARSDIYSLGVVMFEILARRKPFTGKSHFDVLAAHVSTPPPDLAVIRPDLAPELIGVVTRAMAKEQADRFQSCMEFAGALHRAMHLGPGAAENAHAEHPAAKAVESLIDIPPAPEPDQRPEKGPIRPRTKADLTPRAPGEPPAGAAQAPAGVAVQKPDHEAIPVGAVPAVQAAPEPSMLLQRPLLAIFVTVVFILGFSWLISRIS